MGKQKIYWKCGFYDEPIEGSVEISYEYYQSLLEGQSTGKEIVEDDKGYPILQEHIFTLEEVKEHTLYNIQRYDKSEYVNSFMLNGDSIWLNKELRASIANTVTIKKRRYVHTSSIWYNQKEYVLPVDFILSMLQDIEVYADACNSVTQRHIANVNAITDIDEANNYDFTKDYPTKLKFEYNEEGVL